IFQWGNELCTYDLRTHTEGPVKLNLVSDMIHARQHLVPGSVSDFSLGPTGKRVLLESRGQLFTAPAESGDIREIGNQLGSRSKDSAWSPDGKSIAFISDRSVEENIWITPAAGDGEIKHLTHESEVMVMSAI